MTFSQAQAAIEASQAALTQFCGRADPSPAHQPGAALSGTSAAMANVAQICAAAATSIGAIQVGDAPPPNQPADTVTPANPIAQATGIWRTSTGQALAAFTPVRGVWGLFTTAAQPTPPLGPVAGVTSLTSVTLLAVNIVTSLASYESALQGLSTPLSPPASPLPQTVRVWLGRTTATMQGFAAAANAAASYLGSAGGQLSAAIGTAGQALSGLLADVAAIQAAVSAGPLPADPGTLSRYLGDLAQLRVSAWPSPVSSAQQAAYQADIASYATITEELLAAGTGQPTSCPVALLPVRLETRLQTGAGGAGYTLKIRIFPDNIAIDAHDPTLTVLEAGWAAQLQQAVAARATDPGTAAATWAQVAAMFGAPRTAYLNAVDLTDPALVPAPGEPGRPLWARRATTALLPDRWLAVAYGSGGQLLAAGLSSPVTCPLPVGPDTQAPPAPTGPAGVLVDPALAWLVDFGAASSAGMALTLSLDGGAAGPAAGQTAGPPTIGRLIVVGLQAPATADPAGELAGVLTAHRFTAGLQILAPGTPTKNTTTGPAGYTSTDPAFAGSYAREITIPDGWTPPRTVSGDAARLTAALGIAGDTLVAAGDIHEDALAAQAMAALTWRGGWATYLPWLGVPPAVLDEVRGWASAWVKPAGPLATVLIGQQVYGVQPAMALDAFADSAPVPAFIAEVLRKLQPSWLSGALTVLSADLNAQLSRSPVSPAIQARAGLAGISGWMDDSHGVMGTPWTELSGQTSLLPQALAAGRFWGGSTGIAWPPDFLLYPGPGDAPWPVTGSGLPLVPADPNALAAFLAGLAAGSATQASPGSLLTELASYSWASTAGVPVTPIPAFTPRGLLSAETPEPALPPEADELSAAAAWLAGHPDLDFAGLLGGAVDATTYRLDAWATALATYRLGQLRQQPAANAPPLLIGAFGWLENLVGQPALPSAGLADDPDVLFDASNAGFLHAPSLAQATTAAVLRSGYLTHNPAGPAAPPAAQPGPGANNQPGQNAPFAIDLSSRRARQASWLLDGVRAGQPLGALLGYQFERELVESGQGALVAPFRAIAPADPAADQDVTVSPPVPADAIRATDVTDGVTLYQMWQHQPAPAPAGSIWALASPALAHLADLFDAVADAVTAATLHQMLAGNPGAAAATMAAVADGTVTADPSSFLNTPRTGTSIIHRMLLTVPAAPAAGTAGWTATPRTRAEPDLSAWVAGLLPAPASTGATVTLTAPDGTPLAGVAPVPVTLDQLGLGPLDVLDLAGRPAELAQLAVHAVLTAQAGAAPPAAGGILSATETTASTPLALVLDIAGRLAVALAASRPADARDLAPPGASADPGADLARLAGRVTAALADLDAALTGFAQVFPAAEVPPPGSSAPPPAVLPTAAGAAAFTSALLSAVSLGVPGAAPANTGEDATGLQALAGQAYSAWAVLTRRQAAATAAAATASPGTTGPAPAQQLAAGLAQLQAVFGPAFPAAAQLPAAGQIISAASLQDIPAPPGQEPLAWLVKAARIWPALAALYDALTAAEALGSGPALSVRIAQLPAVAGATWAGLPVTGSAPTTGTLSLEMLGAAPAPTGAAAAFVVADWTEAIPSAQETTAITYHYDAPAAQAPNAVLLAVPADRAVPAWSYASLRDTVGDTLNLARIRTVDYLDLPAALGSQAWALPALYLANRPFSTPAVPVDTGSQESFLDPTPVATVTSCTVSGPRLMQGQGGQLQITGSALSGLTPAQFVFSPAGLMPTAWTSSGETAGVLAVTVSGSAPLASYSIRAGAGPTLPNAASVQPRPQAVSCDPSVINQRMTAFTATITVFGQVLGSATAQLTTANGAIIDLSSATPTVSPDGTAASWTLPVAASSYDPNPDIIDMPGHIVRIPPPPPQHVPEPLRLTVTLSAPGAAGPVTFPITLDTIV